MYGSKAEDPQPYAEVSSWWAPPSSGIEKQRECGGGTASRGEGGVPPREGRDKLKVPPGRELGGVLLLMPGDADEAPPGLLSREPLCDGCGGGGPSREFGGGAGPASSRPCSRRRRMLQVANDSLVEEERLSESLVVSFFCLVRRFWNQTLTCENTPSAELNLPAQTQTKTLSIVHLPES